MATGAPLRLVRCPKCSQVLPEVPNVPVYRCGGCGALLQAKNQKKDTKKAEMARQDANFELTNESSHVSEHKAVNSKAYSDCVEDCKNAEDQNGFGDRKGLELGAVDSSSSDRHFGSEDCDMEGPRIESDVYSSTELVHNEPKEPLPSPGAKPEEETENECDPILETDTSLAEAEAEVEGRVSSAVAAAAAAPPEQSKENGLQGIDSMRSRGTCGFTEYGSPSSELSGIIMDDESKSPTARGSHAYDGSISSYEELEHQYVRATHHKAPNFAPPREKLTARGSHAYDGSISSYEELEHQYVRATHHKAPNFAPPREKFRRDQFLVDSMSNDSKWMPEPPGKKKGWDRDELREPERTRHLPPRNHLPPKVPLHRSFQAGVAVSGSFSSQVHEDYETDSILYPSAKLEYQQQEKMKLLRVFRELQDQIDKSCSLEGSANGRVSSWKEKSIPTRYSTQEAPMEETWRDLNRPTMYSRSRLGGSNSVSAQQPQFPRMSFSGEAERQCLHCHPQEWKRSAPLPLCSVQSGYDCYNSQNSFQPRPQRYAEPEFSVSGDQRLRDHVMRKYARDKHVAAKKHFRPKAGGAPFITCYHCSKLLQLPEDFLIFKRTYHKLKCASCSTVLKFSVQNRTNIIPYSPNDIHLAPPPSEADEYSGVMNRRRSTASSSHHAHGYDPVSYSDDFGLDQDDSSHGRKMVYASSFGSTGKRKEFVRNRFSNKYKDPVEAYGSGRPSSSKYRAEKNSSEFEVQKQQRSNSPLHRLMGYSSPSLVIRGTEGTGNA